MLVSQVSLTAWLFLLSVPAVSPPGVVSLANGLAQSLVSLGRFLGPVLGGLLWSRSIAGNPEGYAHGFYM